MNKIRPFREEPNLLNKSGAALAYVVLGWVVASSSLQGLGNLLSIFMLLGILAWALIISRRNIKYFVRYHLTQAILLNIALAMVLWLLGALLELLGTLPGINLISELAATLLLNPLGTLLPSAPTNLAFMTPLLDASTKEILVMTVAVAMAVYTVRGKYAEVPWITDGVRHWI